MNNDNLVCEAVGCRSMADTEVHINVDKGIIPLFLCSKCRSKFHLDEEDP
ncbi:MAG TPA: hypothetical protein VH500_03995 [Nitrososphaeraceae archaeon]